MRRYQSTYFPGNTDLTGMNARTSHRRMRRQVRRWLRCYLPRWSR